MGKKKGQRQENVERIKLREVRRHYGRRCPGIGDISRALVAGRLDMAGVTKGSRVAGQ